MAASWRLARPARTATVLQLSSYFYSTLQMLSHIHMRGHGKGRMEEEEGAREFEFSLACRGRGVQERGPSAAPSN